MTSSIKHVLIPLSAVEELGTWSGLGEWYLAAEVSCQVGSTFKWAGHEVTCSEEVPVWGVLAVDPYDFAEGGWNHVQDEYNTYVPTGVYA